MYVWLHIANPAVVSYLIRSVSCHIGCYSKEEKFFAAAELSPPLCSAFESLGGLSIMSDTLRKRSREPEVLLYSTEVPEFKRFNGEETDLFRHFPLLDKTPAEEQAACSEDVVGGVMRILEEEMSTTCSTFDAPISADNSSASAISGGYESQSLVSDSGIDLCYLLEASDDDLGIPSGPVLDFKDEFCQFPKETFSLDGLSEKPDLKFQGENWDFKNDFENYQQFALYEDCWDASEVLQDYTNRDFVSQDMFLDGDFSAAWTLETSGWM